MKRKGKAKEVPAAVAAVVTATKAVEEKVEAWMVSISDDLNQEGSQNEKLPSYFNLLDNLFEETTSLFDTEGMPDLQSVTDTDSDGEILSYCSPSSDKDLEVPNIKEESLKKSFDDLKNSNDKSEFIPCDEDAYVMTYKASALQGTSSELITNVDLYNLGTSCHMSGVRHCFINFITIDPKPIMAADKQSFNATGKGDLWALLPNGDEAPSRVLLKDAFIHTCNEHYFNFYQPNCTCWIYCYICW